MEDFLNLPKSIKHYCSYFWNPTNYHASSSANGHPSSSAKTATLPPALTWIMPRTPGVMATPGHRSPPIHHGLPHASLFPRSGLRISYCHSMMYRPCLFYWGLHLFSCGGDLGYPNLTPTPILHTDLIRREGVCCQRITLKYVTRFITGFLSFN